MDVAVARLPFPTERLRVTVRYHEPRVLVVPTFHHLAGKESVTLDDKLELIAAGQAIPIAPVDSQNSTLRQDLTTVPIEEIEPCQVVLATRAGERSRLATAFRESARTHLTGRDSESRSSDP